MSYEAVLQIIEGLEPSPDDGTRDVKWLTKSRAIGFSRANDGKIEMFLSGERLIPASSLISEVLEYQTWFRRNGQPELEANRLLFPSDGHFDRVAAFIATEVLRNGAETDLVAAFRRTEPIIELAIRRLRLSDQAFLGLVGEVLVLDALCRAAEDSQAAQIVDSWQGWRESLRDLTWGSIGVEIKTTTRDSSSHQIQGFHQLEPSDGEQGPNAESKLYLVSVGLQWVDQELAFSFPGLVDSILARLNEIDQSESATNFLAHVREYGSGVQLGYDHRTMSRDLRFARPFTVRFVRAYEMTDRGIQILRSPDIAELNHMAAESVMYRIELPARVTGDINPIDGLHQTVVAILE